jgi:hypothetical protein
MMNYPRGGQHHYYAGVNREDARALFDSLDIAVPDRQYDIRQSSYILPLTRAMADVLSPHERIGSIQ